MFIFRGGYILQTSSWFSGFTKQPKGSVMHPNKLPGLFLGGHFIMIKNSSDNLRAQMIQDRHCGYTRSGFCVYRQTLSLGQGSTKQAFTFAYAFAELSPKNVASKN